MNGWMWGKVLGLWLLCAVAAALNGGGRDVVLAPWIGAQWALPLSGITLSVLIMLITWTFVPRLGQLPARLYWVIGGLWLLLTVGFELILGRATGQSWSELLAILNVMDGNLYVLVLFVVFIAPYVSARLRGLV